MRAGLICYDTVSIKILHQSVHTHVPAGRNVLFTVSAAVSGFSSTK